MKRLFLVTTFIIAGQCAFAQKLLKPRVDLITGDTTWSTSRVVVYENIHWARGENSLGANCEKVRGQYILALNIVSAGGHSSAYSTSKGDQAIIKLGDNSLVTLSAVTGDISNATITSGSLGASTQSQLLTFYRLTNDDIAKLQNSKVKVIRVQTSQENFDYEIKPKNAELIANSIRLIVNVPEVK